MLADCSGADHQLTSFFGGGGEGDCRFKIISAIIFSSLMNKADVVFIVKKH